MLKRDEAKEREPKIKQKYPCLVLLNIIENDWST